MTVNLSSIKRGVKVLGLPKKNKKNTPVDSYSHALPSLSIIAFSLVVHVMGCVISTLYFSKTLVNALVEIKLVLSKLSAAYKKHNRCIDFEALNFPPPDHSHPMAAHSASAKIASSKGMRASPKTCWNTEGIETVLSEINTL